MVPSFMELSTNSSKIKLYCSSGNKSSQRPKAINALENYTHSPLTFPHDNMCLYLHSKQTI